MSNDLSYLYFLYLSDPSEENLDRFLRSCLVFLKKQVRYFVYCEGICPSFMGPETFSEDAFELAVEKFWRGIHGPRPPKQLIPWIKKVAYSAVVEEYRSRVRRTGEPVHWVPIEREVQGDDD